MVNLSINKEWTIIMPMNYQSLKCQDPFRFNILLEIYSEILKNLKNKLQLIIVTNDKEKQVLYIDGVKKGSYKHKGERRMDINNLTLEQKKEIAQLYCNAEYGFEGAQTYPACGDCIVCKCRNDTNYNINLERFMDINNPEDNWFFEKVKNGRRVL